MAPSDGDLAHMPDANRPVGRVVAVGASNLTRGFQTIVSTARTAWGPDVQVVAALGHGRSYGATSAFLVRKLPAILESGLWPMLADAPAVPTRALVTDVGNDIVYGSTPAQIVDWVDEAVARLGAVSDEVIVTGLPLDSIRRLSRPAFLTVRSALFPSCRLSHADVIDAAERLHAGLETLAAARGARFLPLRPSWYGVDPIHIRPRFWRAAWQEILGVSCDPGRSGLEALRLYAMRPDREWLWGVERRVPQTGVRLKRGGRVWLY